MNYIVCFILSMTAKLTVTHEWKTPVIAMYGVIPGIHIGCVISTNDYRVVDLETGGDYHVGGEAYSYAYDLQLMTMGAMGRVLGSRISLHACTTDESITLQIQGGHWSSGLCPDWATHVGDRIYFELSCDWWIIRGYVDLNAEPVATGVDLNTGVDCTAHTSATK